MEVADNILCCASCGTVEVDDIELKTCVDCDLVRYCSEECQREDRAKHKQACKKRAAELRDEILFRQPESNHYGDCRFVHCRYQLIQENLVFTHVAAK